jgi:hypothetical protein
VLAWGSRADVDAVSSPDVSLKLGNDTKTGCPDSAASKTLTAGPADAPAVAQAACCEVMSSCSCCWCARMEASAPDLSEPIAAPLCALPGSLLPSLTPFRWTFAAECRALPADAVCATTQAMTQLDHMRTINCAFQHGLVVVSGETAGTPMMPEIRVVSCQRARSTALKYVRHI